MHKPKNKGSFFIALVLATALLLSPFSQVFAGFLLTSQTGSGLGAWKGVSVSGDGTRMVAISGSSNVRSIYVSEDSGVTWSLTATPPGSKQWTQTALSKDGSTIVVIGDFSSGPSGPVISTDFGDSWT